MYKNIIILLIVLSCSALSGNKASIEILSSNTELLSIGVSLTGINSQKISAGNLIYDNITLDNTVSINEPGKPSLPLITRYIQVPANKKAVITITDAVYEIQKDLNVYPAQEIPMRSAKAPEFYFDRNSYSDNDFTPDNIAIIKEYALLGNLKVALLNINPVQYNPVTSEIKVYKSFKVNISFESSSDEFNPLPNIKGHSYLMEKVYRSAVMNYEDLPDTFSIAPRMLIITADDLFNAVLPFSVWKNTKGIKTTVIKKSELGFGSNPDTGQVRTYLMNLYTAGQCPEYVLLIGDVNGANYIPWFRRSSSMTDHPYSCLNGQDILPEICIARISVSDTSELSNAVTRLINYEANPNMQVTDWYKRAMVLFSQDGIDPINGQLIRNVFLNEGGFTNVDMVAYNQGGLITGFKNGGLSWIWFIGHGSATSWAVPSWHMSNIPSLTYGSRIPSIISVACANNDLDYSSGNCYGEEYTEKYSVNTPSNFMGYTENCAFYTTDTLAREMVYAYFRRSIYDFGSMINWGKLQAYMYFNGNSTVYGTIYQTMNLGDPSQEAYSDVPKNLAVEFSLSENINVNVKAAGINVNKALVAISQNNSLKASGYTDATGNFSAPDSTLIPGIEFRLVVTGKNLKPYNQLWMPVSNKNINTDPFVFKLEQNYPNPFNPVTEIRYELPKEGYVTLKVFNSIGKEIAVLVDKVQKAGYYDVTFNGQDLSSGVYFYQLKYNDNIFTKKMMLTK